ncbi:hypothetical protein B0H15DRAFT_563925 [Mycena belliarum]|uniref:C2H2-type domain-containing protein n=1 Tax=Mycena belliarum TaxID=1033014 RepID=A0AAD6TTM2_9AGAR|nr:hypothetical protein B0H15DRAFT_563925 [Mycena belliae]
MGSHVEQRVRYNFRPNFPNEIVERYPSLTLALADSYPRPRTPTPALDESGYRFPDFDVLTTFIDSSESSPPTTFKSPSWHAPFPHSAVSPDPTLSNNCEPTSPLINDWRSSGYHSPASFGSVFSPIPPRPRRPAGFPLVQDPQIPSSDTGIPVFDKNFNPICTTEQPSLCPSVAGYEMDLARKPPAQGAAIAGTPRLLQVGSQNKYTKPRVDNKINKRRSPEKEDDKTYRCKFDSCDKGFKRQGDLNKHHNAHTHAQPYSCGGCSQKFGVLSNMLRHRIKHGFPRKGKTRPIPQYHLEFDEPAISPPVKSDFIQMGSPIIWDSDGPMAKRKFK